MRIYIDLKFDEVKMLKDMGLAESNSPKKIVPALHKLMEQVKENDKRHQVTEEASYGCDGEYLCPCCEEYVQSEDNFCSQCGARLGWDTLHLD